MTTIGQISSDVSITENLTINQHIEIEAGVSPVVVADMFTSLLGQLGQVLRYIENNQIKPLQNAVWLDRSIINNLQKQLIEDRESLQHLQSDSMQYKEVAQRLGKVVADIQLILNRANKEISQHQSALTHLDKELETSKVFANRLQDMIIANKKELEQQQRQLLDQQEFQDILARYGNNSEHLTPFHCAIKEGDAHAVEIMLNHGVAIDLQDGSYTPLHRAIEANHMETAALLIQYGSSVDVCDEEGYTPLHRAIAANQLDATLFLLQHGADARAIVQKGIAEFRCLDLARQYATPEMVLLFIDKDTTIFEEKVKQHVIESSIKKINPIEFAFQKFENDLAEHLLQMRARDLVLKKPTFEFPGYEFRRPFQQGNYPACCKPTPVKIKGGLTGSYTEILNRVDVETIKILMKYDSQNLWHKHIAYWLSNSYSLGDLESIALLYPIAKKVNVTISCRDLSYLVDPFLSDTPIDRGSRYYFYTPGRGPGPDPNRPPSVLEYRSDDNKRVKELKKQIQEMINSTNS